jgi:type I restriction enzyme M protein
MVSISEISDPKNDYNLNIPRYINNQEEEDLQDIDAHLRGDIPEYDIDDLQKYWYMYPSLRNVLFGKGSREKYLKLEIKKDVIKSTILGHPEFVAYSKELQNVFDRWKKKTTNFLKKLDKGTVPKDVIQRISEDMLKVYEDNHLIEKYDMYQHMLNYWTETMQDDLYELAADGWKAGNEVARQIKEGKKSGKASRKEVEGIEGLEGRLIPPTLLIEMFFRKERSSIEELEEDKEAISLKMKEMEEEHSGEEGILEGVKSDKGKVIKGIVHDRVLEIKETIIKSSNYPATKKNLVKAIKKSNFSKIKWKKGVIDNQDLFAELDVFHDYLGLMDEESHLSKEINETLRDMEGKVTKKYSVLSIDDIKNIVVDNKWMASIEKLVQTEIDRISQRLSGRIKELAERYENTLPELNTEINKLEKSVNTHLKEMGFTWK